MTNIMAIINLTDDSFSGDGVLAKTSGNIDLLVAQSLSQIDAAIKAGANIIDLGAESSRPGFTPLDYETEAARLMPVIKAARAKFADTQLSIDTMKTDIALEALAQGVNIINDVSGHVSQKLCKAIAACGHDTRLVLMDNITDDALIHYDEKLGGLNDAKADKDFIKKLKARLLSMANLAQSYGLKPSQIILDPGLGFGKNIEQNFQILACLPEIKALGYDLLVGLSRKGFIGRTLQAERDQRLAGSLAGAGACFAAGVDIIRVHDVRETADFFKIMQEIQKQKTISGQNS